MILNGNKYLFITDGGNNRIIGSDENGFRCIVACLMSSGATSNQLSSIREVSLLIVLEIYLLSITVTIEFKSFVYQQISVIEKGKSNDSIFSFDYLGPTTTTTTNANQSKSFKEKFKKKIFVLLKS